MLDPQSAEISGLIDTFHIGRFRLFDETFLIGGNLIGITYPEVIPEEFLLDVQVADFQIYPVRLNRESKGDFPVIIGMFTATASARTEEKDFAGSIPFEFSVVYGSGQFREAFLVSGSHLRGPEIVSFREVHDGHRDIDPVHIAFRIHADRAAVIRGVRWSS